MDIARVAELQRQIARDLVEDAPDGWERLEVQAVCLAGVAKVRLQHEVNGVQERFRSVQAALAMPDLQEAMVEAEKGTWFSVICVVEPPGSYSFSFNYDEHVTFPDGSEPLEETWVKELRRHPRPWALIPGWHPVKRKFTADEWDADLASLAE